MKVLRGLLFLLFIPFIAEARTLLFIGDSLTEGYGLEQAEAYPAQLEKMLHAEGKKDYKVINGGISGSTTANAASRVKWYQKVKPDIVVFALGANDGLRGLDVSESKKNLKAAIKLARESGMKILLAGMKMPKNYGEAYRRDFEAMYDALSKEEKVPLLAFLLDGVGGVPKMNQPDGIHPSAEGQKKVAQNLLKALRPYL